MGDRESTSLRIAFRTQVHHIIRHARIDLVLRRGAGGLFFGLLPGLAAEFLAGTFTLPLPALWIAACGAAAGLAAGAAAGLLARIDPRVVLVHGDTLLGTRELSSTAFELSASDLHGRFADAVIEDAAALLKKTASRRFLGRLRLPLAPFIPLVAALIAAAAIFPVDFRLLFPWSALRQRELADIGEDLKSQGQTLENAARASNLGRSLALSQELAQLGRELAAHTLALEEALDRMSQLEGRFAQEYQLALQEGRAISPPLNPGEARDSAGESGSGQGEQGGTASSADQNLNSLGNALNRLREDTRRLSDRQNQDKGRSGGTAEGASGGTSQPGDAASAPADGSGSQGDSPGTGGGSAGQGQSGGNTGGQDQSGRGTGSQAGNAPALVKTGDPTAIAHGTGSPGLRADGNSGEGDMARLLVRSLPDLAGSKLPDATVLDHYARQAESALARDEVPQKLREYVKGYFTTIGMPEAGTGN